MFLTMGVGLYTSRLVLQTLGVEDFGIYGLVGGIVTMFAFLNSAMSTATQRYLSFDIGKRDTDRLKKTFNATLNIHILIAGIIVLLAETVGLWFVNYKLNIPTARMHAANWVYQFSIFTFVLGVIQVPYNALLIAREHMNVYAYMSILESVLKLVIVFILVEFGDDKLILYAILTFIVSFIVRTLYKIYCKKHFKESQYEFYYDKIYYRELISYSGWNLFGNVAAVARGQGSNILLNLFFGPIANAAYSLTIMVQGIIGNFVSNFQTALNPQITKNYAIGNVEASLNLMYKSSKYSYFAMFILVAPFLYNINYIMQLWLGKVPDYAIQFIELALIYTLIETISNPLMTGIQATGNISKYQIVVGGLIFLNLPLVLIIFKLTEFPHYMYISFIGISIVSLLLRLYFIKHNMEVKINGFYKQVLSRIIFSTSISVIILYYLSITMNKATNFFNFITQSVIITILLVVIIYILGSTKSEKLYVINTFKNKLKI